MAEALPTTVGLAALAAATWMLVHPDVPVDVLHQYTLPGLLFVVLVFAGAGCMVAATGPPGHRLRGATVAVAMLPAVPLLVFSERFFLVGVSLAAGHLVLAPVLCLGAPVGVGTTLLRRAAVVSGVIHAVLMLEPWLDPPSFGPSFGAPLHLPLAAALGSLAWGLGEAGTLLASRGVPGPGDPRRRAVLLLASALFWLTWMEQRLPSLQASLLALPVAAAGAWTLWAARVRPRPAGPD